MITMDLTPLHESISSDMKELIKGLLDAGDLSAASRVAQSLSLIQNVTEYKETE